MNDDIEETLLNFRKMCETVQERIDKLIPDGQDHIKTMLLAEEIGVVFNKTPMEIYYIIRIYLEKKENKKEIIIKKGRSGGIYKFTPTLL